jgi:hypothetical protein
VNHRTARVVSIAVATSDEPNAAFISVVGICGCGPTAPNRFSVKYASNNVREKPPGGMPGGFCSGSSSGVNPDSPLLFCTIPYDDANAFVVNGRFLVYDAVHLAADGFLKVLWGLAAMERPISVQQIQPVDGRRRSNLRTELEWRCRCLPLGAVRCCFNPAARSAGSCAFRHSSTPYNEWLWCRAQQWSASAWRFSLPAAHY